MLKVQYCSDLHLEFPENRKHFEKYPIKPEGDILILAGDILPLYMLGQIIPFAAFISDNFEAAFWVPGNHEFYHYDISRFQGSVTTKIFDSITLVNNKTIVYKDINFIFTTLWGRITPPNELYIRDNISDFHVIMKRGAALTPAHFNAMHEASVGFLESELQNSKHEKNVVITHHVPTLLNYPEEYRRSRLNQAFVIEMHDFICAHPIDYWIFGHHHVNIPSFTIGKTRLVTNQLGYVHHNEHRDFDRCAIFEV